MTRRSCAVRRDIDHPDGRGFCQDLEWQEFLMCHGHALESVGIRRDGLARAAKHRRRCKDGRSLVQGLLKQAVAIGRPCVHKKKVERDNLRSLIRNRTNEAGHRGPWKGIAAGLANGVIVDSDDRHGLGRRALALQKETQVRKGCLQPVQDGALTAPVRHGEKGTPNSGQPDP